MARNIEIKARVRDAAATERCVREWATAGPQDLSQDDTFFHCPAGRLKLREFGDGQGELIFYRRADQSGPKESFYARAPAADPGALREVLGHAMGQGGRVIKQRRVYWFGRTRIHLDRVDGLGDFLELEVVLNEDEASEHGVQEARALMMRIGIALDDLLECSYLDLLRSQG